MTRHARRTQRKATLHAATRGCLLAGTAIEFRDFLVYGTAAALVLGPLFFPTFSPVAGTLAAFGTFGVGFVARPLHAVLFGPIGTGTGRRQLIA